MKLNASGARSGVTLVELTVVVSVVSLIAFLSLSAVQHAREVARRTACMNNLKQLGLALHNYTSSHSVFPAASNGSGYSLLSMIMAFEENGALYNSTNFDLDSQTEPSRSDPNYTAATTRLGILLCPSDPVSSGTKFGSTNYAGNAALSSSRFGNVFRVMVLSPCGIICL